MWSETYLDRKTVNHAVNHAAHSFVSFAAMNVSSSNLCCDLFQLIDIVVIIEAGPDGRSSDGFIDVFSVIKELSYTNVNSFSVRYKIEVTSHQIHLP